jgi:sugar/nucleoside kinase (ribokinase family)
MFRTIKKDHVDISGGILEDKSLLECGKLANACGALNASKFGPMEGVVKREVIDRLLEDDKRKNI